jgi:hypothetical protein
MKKINVMMSFVAVASVVVVSGCQTMGGGKAQKEEAAAALVQAQAETAEVQAKLDAALADADAKVKALEAKAVPGASLTKDGTLLFTAQGQSIAKADTGALGVARARLAAETIAKANLLEVVKGGLISSTVSVGDMMFQSQRATTAVNGWLAGAKVEVSSLANEQSRLPDAEPVDQVITATASLELSGAAWENLKDYVE